MNELVREKALEVAGKLEKYVSKKLRENSDVFRDWHKTFLDKKFRAITDKGRNVYLILRRDKWIIEHPLLEIHVSPSTLEAYIQGKDGGKLPHILIESTEDIVKMMDVLIMGAKSVKKAGEEDAKHLEEMHKVITKFLEGKMDSRSATRKASEIAVNYVPTLLDTFNKLGNRYVNYEAEIRSLDTDEVKLHVTNGELYLIYPPKNEKHIHFLKRLNVVDYLEAVDELLRKMIKTRVKMKENYEKRVKYLLNSLEAVEKYIEV